MKKAIYILTAAAIMLTALGAGISAYGAEASSAEDNYTVWIPAAESYVYLEYPEKIAAGSGIVIHRKRSRHHADYRQG